MMNSGNYLVIIAAIIIGLVIHALMYAPQPAIMAEMFPTRMRYSGVSLGYQVTSIVAGSLAPAISVKLLEIYDSSVPIAMYLAAAAVVTLIAVYFTRETKGIDLETSTRPTARNSRRPALHDRARRTHRSCHRRRERYRCGMRAGAGRPRRSRDRR